MKKFIGFAIMVAIITGTVFAQGLPTTHVTDLGFTSAQSSATAGRLRSNADDFIRPDAFAGVRFENWFGMVGFSQINRAAMGYATKLGDIYLGTFYTGQFWRNKTSTDYTEATGTWLATDRKEGVKTYTAIPAPTNTQRNQFAVLIGLEEMGFRLTYSSSYESFSDKDFMAGGVAYNSYKRENGTISPQIAWSMTKNMMEKGVRPWATIDLGFVKNNTRAVTYKYDAGTSRYTTQTDDEVVSNSVNITRPEINAGLGGWILANNNGWRTSANVDYRLQIWSYNNDYNYNTNATTTKIASFNGRNTSNVLLEESQNNHRIRPSISTQWNGEGLRLRANLALGLTLDNQETQQVRIKLTDGFSQNGALENHGTYTKQSAVLFNPVIELGMMWQVAPKLSVNAGGTINLQNIRRVTTTTEGFTAGEPNKDGEDRRIGESKRVATTYSVPSLTGAEGDISNTLTFGVTLNATDNMFIEACAGAVGSAAGQLTDNRFNVFGTATGAPFNFGSILVGLRF